MKDQNCRHSSMSLKIHEACKIGPPSCATELCLPLTYFDLLWLRFHPSERIFFYSFPHYYHYDDDDDDSFFFQTLIPKLKDSLSLTLQEFLPLAGNIVWGSNSQKPFLRYTPGDAVSLVIAECDAQLFSHLSGNGSRKARDLRPLIPHLHTSDSLASILSLQITLFPNTGFSIAVTAHHAVLDGKSFTLFIKAWAYLSRTTQQPPSLSPELRPFLDRTVVADPHAFDVTFLTHWKRISQHISPSSNEKSLRILPNAPSPPHTNELVLATFELNPEDLVNLKKRVLSLWEKNDKFETPTTEKPLYLSNFVVASAFAFTCVEKAMKRSGENSDTTDIAFGFSADFRGRLDPQLDPNYVGNCVIPCMIDTEAEDFEGEDGVVLVAKKIYERIRSLEKGVVEEARCIFPRWESMALKGMRGIAIGGFTRFGVYESDFGWGRPVKVEIPTVDGNGMISMAESRDGNGGVQVGLLLYEHELDLFASSFREGLQGF